jgi:hypothetical protein
MLLMMMLGFCVGGSVDSRWLGCSARPKDITSTHLRHQEEKEEENSILLHIGDSSQFHFPTTEMILYYIYLL